MDMQERFSVIKAIDHRGKEVVTRKKPPIQKHKFGSGEANICLHWCG